MSFVGRSQCDIGVHATRPTSNERGRQLNKGRPSASLSELAGRNTTIPNDRVLHPATNIIRTDIVQTSG